MKRENRPVSAHLPPAHDQPTQDAEVLGLPGDGQRLVGGIDGQGQSAGRGGYFLGGTVAFAHKAERLLQIKQSALMCSSRKEWNLMPLQAAL